MRQSFPLQALALALGVSALYYAPVLVGKVPLPTDLLASFPPWERVASDVWRPTQHAEMGDLIDLMYPWRQYLGEAFRNGQLPFWNPRTFAGSPFLADPIAAVFYPFNWLYGALPVHLVWSLLFPLRTVLIVFFTALFVRRIGATRSGALFAGFLFGVSGFMMTLQGWPLVDVLMWTPLLLLCIRELRRRPRARNAAVLALPLAMPVLAGHPEVCAYAISTVLAYAVYQLLAGLRRGRTSSWAIRYSGAFLLAAGLAVGICAVQLVPSLDWLPRITRRLAGTGVHLPVRTLLLLVSRDSVSNPHPIDLWVPDRCGYMGVGTLLLAPLAFFARRRTEAAFFGLLTLSSAGVVFGLWPFSPLFRSTPGFQSLPGHRLLGLLDFGLAVLAGLAFTALQGRRRSRARQPFQIAIWIASTAAVAVGIGILGSLLTGTPRVGFLRSTASAAVLLVASALAIGGALLWPRRRREFGAAAALTIAFDLISFSIGHVPFVSPASIFPDAPLFRFLKAHTPGHERVLFLFATAPLNTEMMYGLDTPAGYPQVLRRTSRFMSPLNDANPKDNFLRAFFASRILPERHLLDLLSVRFLVANTYNDSAETLSRLERVFPLRWSEGTIRVFENSEALPRAYSVPLSGIREVPREDPAEEVFPPALDGRRSVVLEGLASGASYGNPGPPAEVSLFQEDMSSVSGQVRGEAASVLVLSQAYYPGWRATVDGRETEILRANFMFSAIFLPPGAHRFVLKFRPVHFDAACGVSALSLTVVVVLLSGRRRILGRR